jgi:hypothetical protein
MTILNGKMTPSPGVKIYKVKIYHINGLVSLQYASDTRKSLIQAILRARYFNGETHISASYTYRSVASDPGITKM